MERKKIIIVDSKAEGRSTLVRIINSVSKEIMITECNNVKEAQEQIPLKPFDILFGNMKIEEGEKLFAVLENPSCKFVKPANYLLYSDQFEAGDIYIPKLKNLSLMKLPLNEELLTKYVRKIVIGAPEVAAGAKKARTKKEYMRIPMEIVLRFGKGFPFDIFIKLSDNNKILQLSYKDEERQDQFQKYFKKGLTSVYVVKHDYLSYLSDLKKNMSNKFADPDTIAPTEDTVDVLNSCHKAVKAVFDEGFVPKESIALAKEVSANSMKMIEKTPNIFQFFVNFKDNCSQQFMLSMITGYLTTCMLETFDWATSSIKEKLNLAGMLCDITLDNDDFKEIKAKKDQAKELPPKIIQHPTKTMEMLKPNMEVLSSDILTIIVEHHERPDGSGYPGKMSWKQVNTLSAIFIVAYDFVNRLVELNFNYQEINNILNDFGEKYGLGNYRKAYKALHEVFMPTKK